MYCSLKNIIIKSDYLLICKRHIQVETETETKDLI